MISALRLQGDATSCEMRRFSFAAVMEREREMARNFMLASAALFPAELGAIIAEYTGELPAD